MPCRVDGPFSDAEQGYPRALKAAMCGILSALDGEALDQLLGQVDWSEAGVTREWLVGWWAEHKREDAARRNREAMEATRERLAGQAWAKLTHDEKAALKGRIL